MKNNIVLAVIVFAFYAAGISAQEMGVKMCEKILMERDGIVRLSKIEVYPQYLEVYKKIAVEVAEVSLRTEPGVLTMYTVVQKDNPCLITILETYASQKAYQSHIASSHFQKYKRESLPMVKSLELCDQIPLNSASKIINTIEEQGQEEL